MEYCCSVVRRKVIELAVIAAHFDKGSAEVNCEVVFRCLVVLTVINSIVVLECLFELTEQ
jgi:hypothetical protein